MATLEHVTMSLDEWWPSIKGVVDNIKLNVSKPKLEVSKISRNWEHTILDQLATALGIFSSTPLLSRAPSSVLQYQRPTGNASTMTTGRVDLG